MPGMTGIELLRTARELNPNAMRILLTGYSDLNAIIGSINEGEIFRFINKPWSNDDLTTTVARAVSAARATQAAEAKLGDPAAVAALEAHEANGRSEEHTSELQSLMRISYAVFCLKKKNKQQEHNR